MVLRRPRRRSDARWLWFFEHKLRGYLGGGRGALVSEEWNQCGSLYLESALVRTALIAGDIAMGGMSGTTMAAPRLQGADPIIVASFANALQYRFVVRPDIKSVADLKGKRVGVAGFGLGLIAGRRSY